MVPEPEVRWGPARPQRRKRLSARAASSPLSESTMSELGVGGREPRLGRERAREPGRAPPSRRAPRAPRLGRGAPRRTSTREGRKLERALVVARRLSPASPPAARSTRPRSTWGDGAPSTAQSACSKSVRLSRHADPSGGSPTRERQPRARPGTPRCCRARLGRNAPSARAPHTPREPEAHRGQVAVALRPAPQPDLQPARSPARALPRNHEPCSDQPARGAAAEERAKRSAVTAEQFPARSLPAHAPLDQGPGRALRERGVTVGRRRDRWGRSSSLR